MEESKDLIEKEFIDNLAREVNAEAEKIKKLDKMLTKMPPTPAKEKFQEDLLEMCNDYSMQIDILAGFVEKYIKQETDRTAAIPFTYVKFLKTLRE
jgi:hypothetical protein